jgi:hypothetical protein
VKLLTRIADLDPKEIIKLLLLFGTIAAGCQINRHEIKEVEAASDSEVAVLNSKITALNRRLAKLERPAQHRTYRKPEKPKGLMTRLWSLMGG